MARPVCCTTSGALCFWGAVFFVVYGAGLTAMAVSPGLERFDQSILLMSLGVACAVNFGWNRSYHCAITGPLFLGVAAVVAAVEANLVDIDVGFVWGAVLVGTGAAALLEARFARGASVHSSSGGGK